MADRSVSVPMTFSDHERPDARNQFFFQADLINAGYVSHVIAFAQTRRAVCQRQLSFLSVLKRMKNYQRASLGECSLTGRNFCPSSALC